MTTEIPEDSLVTAPAADGRAWFADGSKLRCWQLDGTVTEHATLPQPIEVVSLLDDHTLFAVGEDGSGYLITTTTPVQFGPSPR